MTTRTRAHGHTRNGPVDAHTNLTLVGDEMAKHPHKLFLKDNKTWKCALDGCSFFVHLGLAHILEGKSAECWDCNDSFIISESSLKEPKPRCNDCKQMRMMETIPEPTLEPIEIYSQ